MKKLWGSMILVLALAAPAAAKVDLVSLPVRDKVQLTIYNSADLTLARESRALTLTKGVNELQFSWENTLIDPTSLEMHPVTHAADIDVLDLTFPPRVRNLGIWKIQSSLSGDIPVEINYLTSGLAWRAFYLGTLNKEETAMHLDGYVRVTNNSGEDYENAQVRLIVGKVNLLDQIAVLANQQAPYGRPDGGRDKNEMDVAFYDGEEKMMLMEKTLGSGMRAARSPAKKKIVKEGLSEYFLYTIEGTESIPHGWSKRLPSFDAKDVPVINLYKYEEERYGSQVMHFLSFANDKKHKLGETPIPGGVIKAFRSVDDQQHLSYVGQSQFKYIPVDEDVELSLGAVAQVIVEPVVMKEETNNYQFDRYKNISGWDSIQTVECSVNNTRDIPVKVEITRNIPTQYWKIKNKGDYGKYEKVDVTTVKYTLSIPANTKKVFTYTLTTSHGTRER